MTWKQLFSLPLLENIMRNQAYIVKNVQIIGKEPSNIEEDICFELKKINPRT